MKKLEAFTLTETLIVLVVLALMIVITVLSTSNLDQAKEKKIQSLSQNFYSNVENTYIRILYDNTSNGSITGLLDKNNDKEINSQDLRDYFLKYLDGEETPCGDLTNNSTQTKDYLTDAQCAMFTPNIVAAFYLDTDCDLSVNIKEYYSDNQNIRTTDTACGRILYGLKDSKGEFARDLFTIALGKRNIK